VSKPSSVLKNWDLLRDKATTDNHAINRDAYGMMPHLFFNLAVAYPVPAELLLTIFFLWDKTVGTDIDAPTGRCSQSQIPVRQRNLRRWLAALTQAGFWECREKSGLGDKKGSLYAYKNPSAEDWETFFRVAHVSQDIAGVEDVEPEIFGRMFARALGKIEGTDQQVVKRILHKMAAVRAAKKKPKR
jgi:hypothetical protein